MRRSVAAGLAIEVDRRLITEVETRKGQQTLTIEAEGTRAERAPVACLEEGSLLADYGRRKKEIRDTTPPRRFLQCPLQVY